MVHGRTPLVAAIAGALIVAGCGLGGSSTTADDGSGPESVMTEFLDAIRNGDEERAAPLLTTVARQKAEEMGMVVAPPGSDTASFKILESEVEGDEAQVATDWTDFDADGKPHTDRIVWLMRKEQAGWRIQGMATRMFADLPPIVLNFEDPADMLRKQSEAEEEIARRDARNAQSAQTPASDDTKVR